MMKTYTLRNQVLLLLLLTGMLNGPQLSAQTFSAMLVGGVNLSQIDGDKLGGFNKLGFNTGARVSAKLSDRWSLSTEFLYSQQGASRVPTDDISSQYDKIRLNFVEVPLMINFSDWKILASAGVSYNRLINYEVINDVGSNITDVKSEDYNTDIASLVLGASYFFSEKVALNIRWSRHLTNLKKKPEDSPEEEEAPLFKGRNLGIRLYYIL